jgi:hypothetical protein
MYEIQRREGKRIFETLEAFDRVIRKEFNPIK